MTTSEIKFLALVAFMLIVSIGVIFDPFNTASHSYRTAGALVYGPVSLMYGIVGLVRGSFPELVDAKRDGIQWKFWFCTVVFIAIGVGGSLLGLDAIGALGR
jgi:hypothetical protein